MQEFFILKGSTNPVLEMELIDDGRYSFQKSFMNKALQDSVVTFSMIDVETNTPKISNAKANVVLANNDSCEEKYILQYQWKDRDVKNSGVFKGFFEIKFNGNISENGQVFPTGNLRVPIGGDLIIIIK